MVLALKTGGTYIIPKKQADKSARPTYHYSPGSYNAQKGKLFLQISSLDCSNVNFNELVYPEANQTLEYATKLSPNMSVPVLEIDGNVVVNDSYDIHKYLIEHYPGKGNSSLTEDQKSLQEDYIQTHLKWDEYLFSYRCMPKFLGGAFHQIRLVELSKAVKTATTEGKLDEILMDGRTVKQAYIDKVVQTRSLIRIGCDDDTLENLQQRIKANEEFMEAILISTDELLASHKLLMTDDELTSADVYLAVLLNRIATVNGELLEQIFAKYPKIESWWKHFNTLKESEALAFGPSSKIAMLFRKGPRIFLHSLGMLNPEPLPDDIKQEVVKELDRFMSEYYKV